MRETLAISIILSQNSGMNIYDTISGIKKLMELQIGMLDAKAKYYFEKRLKIGYDILLELPNRYEMDSKRL
jgi:hypothetical protein